MQPQHASPADLVYRRTAAPLHVVQLSWDYALFDPKDGDSRQRQGLYSELLNERRPASRMTVIVLGAPQHATGYQDGTLHVLPLHGRWLSLPRLLRMLRSLHRENPISVIASQSPMEEAWLALAFARRRIPVIAQLHFDLFATASRPAGNIARTALGAARHAMSLKLLRRYDAVRTVAPRIAQQVGNRGAANVVCIPVPILDLERFLSIGSGARHPHVLFVGRLAPEKNLRLWLQVARRVLTMVPQARFDIVGSGSELSALVLQAQSLGLAEAITFHGNLPREELPAAFATASVLLLTSRHEGFGRVLVEAMAAGVAVVSTRTTGAIDVLADGEAGHLADVDDAEALASAVTSLLVDAELRSRFAAAGRKRIEGRYDPKALAGRWVELLIATSESHPRALSSGSDSQ